MNVSVQGGCHFYSNDKIKMYWKTGDIPVLNFINTQ